MQEDQGESAKKSNGGIKLEVEIMGRKYTSIPAMRRQLWKANKEIEKLEKEADYRKNLIKKIKEFFVKSGISVKVEKTAEEESGQEKK